MRNASSRLRIPPADRHHRRGMLAPAIAVILLVFGGCLALVLDRLWLDAAAVETETCAEAAALAAATELASDDLLRKDADPQRRLIQARLAAAHIAARNLVAGEPVLLNGAVDGDIRFGQLVEEEATGQAVFIETNQQPTSVQVTAQRTRRRNNPVSLFLRGVTGQARGDIVMRAEATIDNRLLGVRPQPGVAVPALPLAILNRDPAEKRQDTWQQQIEGHGGSDQLRYDAKTGRITAGKDGIVEIVLHSMASKETPVDANVQFVDFRSGLRSDALVRQIESGLTAADLEQFDGELVLTGQQNITLTTEATIIGPARRALQGALGQPRLCFLYEAHAVVGHTGLGRARCVGLVACRVMEIRELRENVCEIIMQPCVMTTTTALLADDERTASSAQGIVGNRYIYKRQLTH